MTVDPTKHGLEYLKQLQTPTGLFVASGCNETGYDKVWLRDNFYTSLAFIELGDYETVDQIYHGLLDIMLKHEGKIDWAIENRLEHAWQFIHARYNPDTLEEFHDAWGNKQNDAIGAILFGIGLLEKSGHSVIRDDNDQRIIEKLVKYLRAIEYWKCEDNGIWEEYQELHASSVGACVAGLLSIKEASIVAVDDELIELGGRTLETLLPRESMSKFTDLSLLSLIYPYNLVDEHMARGIVHDIEYHLKRDMGIIRYKGDRYYNTDSFNGKEAEWVMGFPWLSIIYSELGDEQKARQYFLKTQAVSFDAHLPELYYSMTAIPNKNNPLAWAESLYIVAKKHLTDKM